MADNPAKELKDRLRADLKRALKESRKPEMSVLRSLLAAIDNAEAPEQTDAELRYDPAAASEVERLDLSARQLASLLLQEHAAREDAAADMDRLKQAERAERLRFEAAIVQRYLP